MLASILFPSMPYAKRRRAGAARSPLRAPIRTVTVACLLIAGGGWGQETLWVDATERYFLFTAEWTNRVELADVDGDGMVDMLFANGGYYSEPGEPELNRVFLNRGPKWPLEEATELILGAAPDHARVIKVRDVTGDSLPEIFVGTTFQSQSRMYLGTGRGAYREVTATHLPQIELSVGDLELGDVDDDGRPRHGAGRLGGWEQHDQPRRPDPPVAQRWQRGFP